MQEADAVNISATLIHKVEGTKMTQVEQMIVSRLDRLSEQAASIEMQMLSLTRAQPDDARFVKEIDLLLSSLGSTDTA
jgi:hypothetical protein